jgi:serralysin
VSYSTLTQYAGLTNYEMNTATSLPLSIYNPGNGITSVFDYAALYQADYAGAAANAVFSWQGQAGAVYSVTAGSYRDPQLLLVFDAYGNAIAEDDGGGVDGSDHVSFVAPYSGTYYVDASWVQGTRSGEQKVSLGILEDLGTSKVVVTGGTPRGEQLDGTAGDDDMYGMSGNDSLFGGRGNDFLDGGWGTDSAYYLGERADYTLAKDGGGFRVTDKAGTEGSDLLVNVERLDFGDVDVALDVDGTGGQAYRLYQAAFDRVPDKGGLGYWIAQMDHGASLRDVSQAFVNSAEFAVRYGAHASNADLVNNLYWNVLHRAPEQDGYNYWIDILNSHSDTLAGVLANFSESQENYAQTVGVVSNGVEFQPWVG